MIYEAQWMFSFVVYIGIVRPVTLVFYRFSAVSTFKFLSSKHFELYHVLPLIIFILLWHRAAESYCFYQTPLHLLTNFSPSSPFPLPFWSIPVTPQWPQPWPCQEFHEPQVLSLRQVLHSSGNGFGDWRSHPKTCKQHNHWVWAPWVTTLKIFFPLTFLISPYWATSQLHLCQAAFWSVSLKSSLLSRCGLSRFIYNCCVLLPHLHCHCDGIFLSVCFFHRSLTSNLPNVNLPNVNLPKVPNLPVNIPLGIPQMPTFSAPSWMAAIYDAECVFSSH